MLVVATVALETLIEAERRLDALVAAARAEAEEIIRTTEVRARELEQNAIVQLAAARAQTAEHARERNRAAIQCIEQESSSAVAALEQVPDETIRIIAQAIVRQLVEGEAPP